MKLNAKQKTTILEGSLFHAMLVIAVPVVLSSMLQTMYNLTDTYWLGRIGTAPLAAINLVTPVQSTVIHFGSGLTVAGSVMIAQFVGAGKQQDASEMASQIFTCAMMFAMFFISLLLFLTPALVDWLGADPETHVHAVSYLRVVILDMPFLFAVNLYHSVRQAQGDTLRPLLLNLLGISLNLALDPLLMVVWHLGASGAALATVISKAVPAAVCFRLLFRKQETIHIERQWMRPQGEKLRNILTIGLPTALGGATMQLGFLLMSRNVIAYGQQAMAAYGIGNKVKTLISLPANGIGSAVSTIVGQNMGAGKTDRAEKGYHIGMISAVIFLLAGGLILSRPAVSTAIVRIFSDDEAVIAMAADFLSLMAFWCWTNGILNATTGLFQGTGHTEVTMFSDVSRLWVYRFATLYVCETVLQLGVRSVWLSVVVSNGLAAAVLLILYTTGLWRKNRVTLRRR